MMHMVMRFMITDSKVEQLINFKNIHFEDFADLLYNLENEAISLKF